MNTDGNLYAIDRMMEQAEEHDERAELEERLEAAQRDAKEAEAYAAELEAKLAKIVAIVRSHDTGDMQREDMEVRRILQRIEAELTGGQNND